MRRADGWPGSVGSAPSVPSPSLPPRAVYAQGGMEQLLATEEEKALLLSGLGINMNMAPVCDISTDPSAYMYQRSLGASPEITGQYARDAAALMEVQGVGAVLKHFPGYGNNADTHTGIARDSRSLAELEGCDLIPFQIAIAGDAQAIMVSHTVVTCLDERYPASLSPAVHQYLRETMGFEGVIITDALDMDAVLKHYGDGESAVLAVLAGNDLICTTNYPLQYAAVLEAVQEGEIPMEILDAAVLRVLRWKQRLGLLG